MCWGTLAASSTSTSPSVHIGMPSAAVIASLASALRCSMRYLSKRLVSARERMSGLRRQKTARWRVWAGRHGALGVVAAAPSWVPISAPLERDEGGGDVAAGVVPL